MSGGTRKGDHPTVLYSSAPTKLNQPKGRRAGWGSDPGARTGFGRILGEAATFGLGV